MENGQSELASSRITWARGTPRDTKINWNRPDSTHRALSHQLLSGSQDFSALSQYHIRIDCYTGNRTIYASIVTPEIVPYTRQLLHRKSYHIRVNCYTGNRTIYASIVTPEIVPYTHRLLHRKSYHIRIDCYTGNRTIYASIVTPYMVRFPV